MQRIILLGAMLILGGCVAPPMYYPSINQENVWRHHDFRAQNWHDHERQRQRDERAIYGEGHYLPPMYPGARPY